MTDRFASNVVSTRRHLVAFRHDWRNWGRFIPGRNVKWNRKFPVFPNFQKKDNLERLTEILEMSFRKFFVPFDLEPEFSEILVEWNAPLEQGELMAAVNSRK